MACTGVGQSPQPLLMYWRVDTFSSGLVSACLLTPPFPSLLHLHCQCSSLTGPATVTRVSDLYIELIPPNSLELQVMVTGAYERLSWSLDGMELGNDSVSFTNFRQTLTISSTSSGDAGEYTIAVSANDSVMFQVQEFSESTAYLVYVCILLYIYSLDFYL